MEPRVALAAWGHRSHLLHGATGHTCCMEPLVALAAWGPRGHSTAPGSTQLTTCASIACVWVGQVLVHALMNARVFLCVFMHACLYFCMHVCEGERDRLMSAHSLSLSTQHHPYLCHQDFRAVTTASPLQALAPAGRWQGNGPARMPHEDAVRSHRNDGMTPAQPTHPARLCLHAVIALCEGYCHRQGACVCISSRSLLGDVFGGTLQKRNRAGKRVE